MSRQFPSGSGLCVPKLSRREETGTSGHSDSVKCLLLIALKGGGPAGTEVWSTQQWLKGQFNHPGLGPTYPVSVREEQFVTAAVMGTGQP